MPITPNDDQQLTDHVTTLQQLVRKRISVETAIEFAKLSGSDVQPFCLLQELQDLETAILAIRVTYQIS